MFAEQAYIFRHALMRDAAYQLQLPTDRARLHGLAVAIVEALAERTGQVDALAEELAEHAANAQPGASQPRALQEKEVAYLRRAALHARLQFRNADACALFLRLAARPYAPARIRTEALRMAGALQARSGRAADAMATLDAALALAGAQEGVERGALLGYLALLHAEKGANEEARRLYGEAMVCLRAAPPGRELATCMNNLAIFEGDTGNESEAERLFRKAVEICRQSGVPDVECNALQGVASLLQWQGRLEAAQAMYEQAAAISARVVDKRYAADAQARLALVRAFRAEFEQAESGALRALRICEEAGDRTSECFAFNTLACILRLSGKLSRAARACRQALGIAEELGYPVGMNSAWGIMAGIEIDRGEYAAAEEILRRLVAQYKARGDVSNACVHQGDLARIELFRGDARAALDGFESNLRDLRQMKSLPNAALALADIAAASLQLGLLGRSKAALHEAAALVRQVGDRVTQVYVDATQARLCLLLGDTEAARQWLCGAQALPRSPASGLTALLVAALACDAAQWKGQAADLRSMQAMLAAAQRDADEMELLEASPGCQQLRHAAAIVDEVALASSSGREPRLFGGVAPRFLPPALRLALLGRLRAQDMAEYLRMEVQRPELMSMMLEGTTSLPTPDWRSQG